MDCNDGNALLTIFHAFLQSVLAKSSQAGTKDSSACVSMRSAPWPSHHIWHTVCSSTFLILSKILTIVLGRQENVGLAVSSQPTPPLYSQLSWLVWSHFILNSKCYTPCLYCTLCKHPQKFMDLESCTSRLPCPLLTFQWHQNDGYDI